MRATTTAGTVEGRQVDGVLQFRGVPFAASTAGPNRFRPPQPVEPWTGVRDATEHGPIAPQTPSSIEAMLGARPREQSEDCLTLTVSTPSLDGARPVMVWIHGGGFQSGAPSIPWYDGRRLAAHGDVVVVAIGYRLGALGYLRLDHLLGDDYADSANLGLLDQIAALRWVRDNIAHFGGDPDQVTIFGESAGGMSVATLLATPAAAGLFHRAAPQSGACHHVSSPDEAAEVTDAVLRLLGVADSSPEALLEASADQVRAAQEAAAAEILGSGARGLRLPFQPCIDGRTVPQHPLAAVRDGAAAGIALLTGTTAEEWAMFHLGTPGAPLDEDRLVRRADRFFPGRGAEAVATYRRSRPDATPDEIWIAMGTDYVFRIPALRLADAHGRHDPDTWVYVFSHRSPAMGGIFGACHSIEIPFVFDNVHFRGVDVFVGDGDEVRRLAAVTSSAWLSFARSGDPGHEGLPAWRRYDEQRRAVMELGPSIQLLGDPGADERLLYDGIL